MGRLPPVPPLSPVGAKRSGAPRRAKPGGVDGGERGDTIDSAADGIRLTGRGLAGPCARGHDRGGPSPPGSSVAEPVAAALRRRVGPSPRRRKLSHYARINRARSRGRGVPRSMPAEGRAAEYRVAAVARHSTSTAAPTARIKVGAKRIAGTVTTCGALPSSRVPVHVASTTTGVLGSHPEAEEMRAC